MLRCIIAIICGKDFWFAIRMQLLFTNNHFVDIRRILVKKKILFTIAHLEFSNGVCNSLVELCNSLNSEEYEITVMPLFRCDKHFAQKFCHHVRIKKAFGFYFRGFSQIIRRLPQKWLYNFFVKEKYDVEIAYQCFCSTSLLGASSNKNAKHIAWMHGYDEQDIKWHQQFDYIVACAKSTAEEYKKVFKYPERITYLYNLVNESVIQEKSKETINIKETEDFVFCSVGRLSPEKGYYRLLQCHKRLLDDGFKHKVWIVGDGPEREKLEAFIKQNNLEDSALLIGFDANPFKYVVKSDMFVCSSFNEGMSTVCVEALLLGKSVLSTEVNGAKELVCDNGCGIMVSNDDDALYDGMKYILTNKDQISRYEKRIAIIDNLRYEDRKRAMSSFFEKL